MRVARFVALASWLAIPGCYLSHARPGEAGVDAGDAPTLDAAASDAPVDVPLDAPPVVPGCRARCEPARVVAHVALPVERDVPFPRAFADVTSVADTLVVLMTAPSIGHSTPGHRLVFVDLATGEVRASEPWTASGFVPQHHGGARIVAIDDARIAALALVGAPELDAGFPTGRQSVSLHAVDWSWEGNLMRARRLSAFPGEPTLGCPGGCEAGIALDGTRAVVTYAPDGVLWRTEVSVPDGGSTPWVEERPIDDPDPAPWPHTAAFFDTEHWIAGGGTPDLATPRRSFLFGPDGAEDLAGSEHDLPPLLLGGPSLVLARHVSDGAGAFRVRRLRPGMPVEALSVNTSGVGALSGWLARDAADRTVLAWTSLAPGSLRDTLVHVVSDAPFDRCDVVEPTTVATIPQGITSHGVLAHPHGDALYVMAIANDASGESPQLVVLELRGCTLVE